MADLRHTLLVDEIRELNRRLWSGVVALAAGDVRKGIYQLKLVLATDPSHAAAWRDLGELEASEGGPGRPRSR